MEQDFEQNIPIWIPIAVFVALTVSSFFLQRKLRDRALIQQGQLPYDGVNIPTVEQRVAANKSWSSGQIGSNGLSWMIVMWLLAAVWILCFGAPFVNSFSNPEMKTGPMIVLGVFTALGIVPLYFAIRATLQHFRYGKSLCCIDGKAGVLGSTMTGFVRTSSDVRASGDYVIEIQCNESYETGTGKNRTTHLKSHWYQKKTVSPAGKSSKSGIPFSFDLPKHVPETAYQISRGKINWQLKISAPTAGVDYSAIFVILVFKIDAD